MFNFDEDVDYDEMIAHNETEVLEEDIEYDDEVDEYDEDED